MKWNYAAFALCLCLCLGGCGKKSDAPAKADADANVATSDTKDVYAPDKDKASAEKALFESDDKDKRHAALEDASDYIALVELGSDANGKMTLSFIKNYRGALSTVDLPLPKGLTPNQEYIIFYRDGADGTVGPVHPTYGFYAVDGSDDALLRYMEKKYGDPDEDDRPAFKSKTDDGEDGYESSSHSSRSSSPAASDAAHSKKSSSDSSNDASSGSSKKDASSKKSTASEEE